MKYLSILLIFGLVIGCGPKLPPNLQNIQNKDRLVNAIGILQDAAITGESTHKITTNEARVIITFCNTSFRIIQDANLGWKNDLIKQLDNLKLNSTLVSKYVSSIDLIESLVKAIP